MINKFKSVRSIIAKLYRDLGVNTEINESDVIEWSAEALSMIGSYAQYKDVATEITITDYKTPLPCDFMYLIDISHNGLPISWSSKSLLSNYQCADCQIPTCCTNETFYIKDNWINTSFKDGKLCMVYQAIVTDEDGFPMIPDHVYFDKAIVAYCTYMMDRIQFRMGQLPERAYRDSEKDWYYYVNSARGAANMPTLEQLDKIKNVWVRLMPIQHDKSTFFSNMNSPERRNTY